jgi:hypothetical protein
MKTPAKIVVGCIWFGLVVLLSVFGGNIFSNFMDWLKGNIIRTKIPPPIDFAVTIIPWNIFISLLLCVPLLFIKKRRVDAAVGISEAIILFFFLLGWNLIGIAYLWIYFPDAIGNYSGTPSFFAIEPYAIQEGWSPFQFWCGWWGFIVVSNLVSLGMAFLIKLSRKSKTPLIWS